MAVLPGVPSIEVRILVNGLPTEEWPFQGNIAREASEGDIKKDEHKAGPAGSEDAPLPTRHSYIVSKSGCRFGDSLTSSSDLKTSSLPAMTGGIGIEIHIDGTFYSRFLVDLQNHETQKWNYAHVKTQDGTIKREYPVFSDILSGLYIEDRDNDNTKADMVRVKTMGTIRLTVCAVASEKSVIYEVTTPPMRPEMELAHKATIIHGQGLTHGTTFKNENTDGTNRKRPGGTILRYLGEFVYRYSAHPPKEAKKHELDSSVPAKLKYEEVKMPDGRSLVDLTGDDEE
ncbi:uncharacterized protein FPRO_15832 [Fusarium proliferatum ET1]|uniref:DUF7918 domain-containing protein n=1 Tax=Fusarium proliferatum (strain ET1) TaxID=1227346 RepID=A0A1L7WA30_FUSPR|nr:uncharacterized protein FPRO_15832 [Fusarium proliferatum ET1]CZR49472.1 uncharacterized protein FPRO_15832 [Fusarium proliferatum ET1]